MNSRFPALVWFLLLGAFAAGRAHAAAPSTFVSAQGVDSNTSANCPQATPCRTLSAALSVTSPGGEVIVLNSAEYGNAFITQSVSIVAPDGVYAGVTAPNDQTPAINIYADNVTVTLRGLSFRSASTYAVGLNIMGQVSLVVRDCDFAGLYGAVMLYGEPAPGTGVAGNIQAHIIDTVIHDGVEGIVMAGAGAVSVSHVKLVNLSSVGLDVGDYGYGQAVVSVSDSEWSAPSLTGGVAFQVYPMSTGAQLYIDHTVMTGGALGVRVLSNVGLWGSPPGLGYATVTHSLLSKVGTGLTTVAQGGGTAQITFSDSTINANSAGASNASGGTLMSAGNNLFIGNGSNVVGTLSHVALQ
jgi:hypothetical protein